MWQTEDFSSNVVGPWFVLIGVLGFAKIIWYYLMVWEVVKEIREQYEGYADAEIEDAKKFAEHLRDKAGKKMLDSVINNRLMSAIRSSDPNMEEIEGSIAKLRNLLEEENLTNLIVEKF